MLLLLLFIILCACFLFFLRKKNMHLWLGAYLWEGIISMRRNTVEGPVHIIFCFVDHFEPRWKNPSYEVECRRVDEWMERYPEFAKKHTDSDGKPPQHTFFFPEEEYRQEHMDKLSGLVRKGFGEVEIHLHHDNDTADGLSGKLVGFLDKLLSHGLLKKNYYHGKSYFGFIHGNWALDNSRRDGRTCGVNNELIVLKDAGCYADFTFPSAPHETQTSKINSIYYAVDDPDKPKSHNTGTDVEVAKEPSGDLMIIQGPLALNWKRRKWGILPKIENADIAAGNKPSPDRIDLWVKQGISVKGQEEWVFIKVHTHGAQENNMPVVLGEPADKMFDYLENRYNDGNDFILHYVTAREMYNMIKAAEDGKTGNPNSYRDYILRENNGSPGKRSYSGL